MMINTELQLLRSAFVGRPKPGSWIRADLHPVDSEDAAYFIRKMENGEDRSLLFRSAIPYFSFLTHEARIYLLPDYMGTLVQYPHQIISAACELGDEYGYVLFASLTSAERSAVLQYIEALSGWERIRSYSEEVKKLAELVEASRAKG